MEFKQPIQDLFDQLAKTLNLLSDGQYTQPNKVLFNATIGQHVRHIIELFLCLDKGYRSGIVNYDKRERNHTLETQRSNARTELSRISDTLDRPDKVLLLEASYSAISDEVILVQTNYYREIIYNMEHTVHHMALIRVCLNDNPGIALPENFGVAASTIKYRKRFA